MVDIDTTEEAWLEWRRGGIGASEIAAVCGVNPWASELSVYLRKRGEIPEQVPTEQMRLGKALEPFIGEEFHRATGLFVIGQQTWCVHPHFDWARCTLDGLAVESPDSSPGDALGIFESKSGGDAARFDPLPDHITLQVQWQMFVTGLSHAWVGVFAGGYGLSFRVVEVERDDVAIELMRDRGERFWQRVVAGEPPEITSYAPGDADDLATAYADPEPDSAVELGDEGARLVSELKALREEASKLDKSIKRSENAVKALLGNREAGLVDGVPVVTWREVESSRIDTTALRAAEPDLAARYLTTTATRRFLVK